MRVGYPLPGERERLFVKRVKDRRVFEIVDRDDAMQFFWLLPISGKVKAAPRRIAGEKMIGRFVPWFPKKKSRSLDTSPRRFKAHDTSKQARYRRLLNREFARQRRR